MNAVIYYFSATGNSLVVARDLAQRIGNAQVVPITHALKHKEVPLCDVVGIVFPVYMFGVPLIVAEFVKSLRVKTGVYVFSVATLGGLPGRAHSQINEMLRKNSIKLAAGFSVRMPGNYTPLYDTISEDKQKEMFKKEKERVGDIADIVRERKVMPVEEKPFLPNLLLYKLLYKGGSAMIPLSAKDFWYTDACTKCGLCAKVCPVANIEMRDGHPVWLDHCQHCMACLHWCPVEAIQYKKSTIGRKRYHHPEVISQEIMDQA